MMSSRRHWPEYLMEAVGLGLFMVAAAAFGTLLEYPGSPVRAAIPDAFVRRVVMGAAMGLTAASLIYSPWGRRSGAHLNPAVTFTFWRLGKVAGGDAMGYAVAQFAGGTAGLLVAHAVLGRALAEAPVDYVATRPGTWGVAAAFAAEIAISFLMMSVVLWSSNSVRWAGRTGWLAGALVMIYIAFEGPISGMSMNPARTFASAVPGGGWSVYWIYVAAPLLGMLLAAEVRVRRSRAAAIYCAKLHHDTTHRCIFRCDYPALAAARR
jgi:aquaporin Z